MLDQEVKVRIGNFVTQSIPNSNWTRHFSRYLNLVRWFMSPWKCLKNWINLSSIDVSLFARLRRFFIFVLLRRCDQKQQRKTTDRPNNRTVTLCLWLMTILSLTNYILAINKCFVCVCMLYKGGEHLWWRYYDFAIVQQSMNAGVLL